MRQSRVIGACIALSSAILLLLFGLEASGSPWIKGYLPIGGGPLEQFVVVYSVPLGVAGIIYAVAEIVRALYSKDNDGE